ncbi:MAG: hypothetical protein FOGNACKC_01571 [Anaerolineae bacterium]|nr:hypothetical protein [Anaerolineae bacterium]
MANFRTHTVKPGESLADIAKRYGVPVGYIEKANSVDSAEEGQVLTIPAKHNATPVEKPEDVAKEYNVAPANVVIGSEQRFIVRPPVVFPEYVMQANETLGAVAHKFGLSSQYIAEANDTESPRPGQILKIPIKHNIKLDEPTEKVASLYGVQPNKVVPISNYAVVIPPQTGAVFPKHLVQPGETINSIAGKYNVLAKHILLANNIETPHIGQIIGLPLQYSPELGGSPASLAKLYEVPEDHVLETDNVVLPPPRFIEHVVQSGETLADIAQKYSVETRLIIEANGAGPLKPGQVLVLPIKYIIKMNDSTSAVGRRYGVPADHIIPQDDGVLIKPDATRFPQHLVQPGETLTSLAEKYGVDPSDIMQANHTDLPQAGQILTMPVVKQAAPGDTASLLAEEYGVSVDNVTHTSDRVFYVLPVTGRSRLLLPLLVGLVALLALVLVGALLYRFWPIGAPQFIPGQQEKIQINAPADGANVLLGSPIQVLSQHSGDDISRAELYVAPQGQPGAEKLMRADIPVDGVMMQSWLPVAEGNYTLRVVSVNTKNTPIAQSTVTVRVAANPAIQRPQQQVGNSGQLQLMPGGGEAFQPPPGATATPEPPVQTLAACSAFNAPGAPVIRTLRVVGVEDGAVSRATNAPAKPISLSLGDTLLVDWEVDGTRTVEFDVTGPSGGQPTTYTFNNGGDRLSVPLQEIGSYQISMRAYPSGGECQQPVEKQILVISAEGKIAQVVPQATLIIPPTPTATIEPTPTPTRYFDPPPPAPGVPPGPTQDQLPELRPPVCDAADLLGVYTPNTGQRIEIKEPDEIPAKTVGGSTIFRAWRLQNTGTCTWGPGYELAFYGGRSMGSGGVSFENTWPSEPGRRNIVVDGNRLIVPQGKPNQVANVEVLLQAPVTPGIHQSYWRMRNPQGVYFGPIMGVTLDVVRQCEFGIYGAPTINKFEILGVGNVYRPINPISVEAQQGDQVTLDWNVINATNVDIVVESPTGETETLSTGDPSDRKPFIPNRLGRYIVTLYADNGACTVSAIVYVEVVPREDDTQTFIMSVQQTADISEIRVDWKHADKNVNQFELVAQTYAKTSSTSCLFGLTEQSLWDWAKPLACSQSTGFAQVTGNQMPSIYGIVPPSEGVAEGVRGDAEIPKLTPRDSAVLVPGISAGGQLVRRGEDTLVRLPWQGQNAGYATIRNVLWGLCPADGGDYKVLFALTAYRNGKQVGSSPTSSLSCNDFSKGSTPSLFGGPAPQPTSTLPVTLPQEIPDDSGQ